jgi:hypothetical protein
MKDNIKTDLAETESVGAALTWLSIRASGGICKHGN